MPPLVHNRFADVLILRGKGKIGSSGRIYTASPGFPAVLQSNAALLLERSSFTIIGGVQGSFDLSQDQKIGDEDLEYWGM